MPSDLPHVPTDADGLIARRYRLGQSLGKGTFGEVFYAEDTKFDPPRIVALKLLHPHFISDPQVREDIRREASILARFDHPNILQVLDFEVTPDLAFIVTKLAPGGSLAKRIRPDVTKPPLQLPLDEVARYLQQIASGLDEAHAHGLIHRDIKPLNILLDARDQLLLADFGLAAAVGSTASSSVMVETAPSGTPQYMAPEQWRGQAGKPSDIYALGVLLYQMITGQTPFQGNVSALMGQHLNSPVPRLSERAPRLKYPPALDAVIAAAMIKDPRNRLKPAGELYRRFKAALDGVPAPSGATTGILQRPSILRTTSLLGGNKAAPISSPPTPAPHVRPPLNPKITGALTPPPAVNSTPTPAPTPVVPHKVAVPATLLSLSGHEGAIWTLAWSPDSKILASGSRDKTVRLWNVEGQSLAVLRHHSGNVQSVEWSPDGKLLASGSADNTLRLWSASGRPMATMNRHTGFIQSVAWSPGGDVLASASGDKTVRLWDTEGNELAALFGHTSGVYHVAWSPDGTVLASSSYDKTIRLWNPQGQLTTMPLGHSNTIESIAWSPNSQILASSSVDRMVRLWAQSGRLLAVLTGHREAVWTLAWSPNSQLLASGSSDNSVRLWSPDGKTQKELVGHTDRIWSVAWAADGQTLASGSSDQTVRLWNIDGRALATLRCPSGAVCKVAWSPNGQYLAASFTDGTLQICKVEH